MKSRILVALVGIPLLLVILLACPPFVTALAVALLSVISAREFLVGTGLLTPDRMALIPMLAALAVPVWTYFGGDLSTGAAAAALVVFLLFLIAVLRYPNIKFEGIAAGLFAGILIPLSLSGLIRIRTEELGPYLILLPIAIPFLADAGAYFVGITFGKHKMTPLLSPHKSVEGAVGGMAAGILTALIYCAVLGFCFHLQVHYAAGILYGIAGSAISILGDLAFSMIKRETGIKDYGTIFRAHGGVLDRFDSVIFTLPLIEILYWLLPLVG